MICKEKGRNADVIITTVNISSLNNVARRWLSEQNSDMILMQEHRRLTKKAFGHIPGYSLVFSLAR